MTAIEKLKQLVLQNPDIELSDKNVCVFRALGSLQISKQVTTTQTKKKPGIGVGVSLPVAGPFRVGVGKVLGGSKQLTKTKTVYDKMACTFYMTFTNFIIKTAQGNINVDFDNIKDIEMHKDGIVLKAGPVSHRVILRNADVQRFMSTFELIGKAGREGAKIEDLL